MKIKIKYREGNPSDIDQIARVLYFSTFSMGKKYFPAWKKKFPIPKSVAESFFNEDEENLKVRVALDGNLIVGVSCIHEYKIEAIYILPSYQGLGIGKALLSWAEEEIAIMKYPKIELLAEIGSIDYYIKNGYKIYDIKTYDGARGRNIPFVKMKKPIKKPG